MSTKKYRKTAKADWYRTALVLFLFITVMVFSSIFYFLAAGILILIIITGTHCQNWHTKTSLTCVPYAVEFSSFNSGKFSGT